MTDNDTLVIEQSGPLAGPQPAPRELARTLIEAERLIEARQPRRVLLRDDSDAALAAALVASKMPIELAAEPVALETHSPNALLISRLIDP